MQMFPQTLAATVVQHSCISSVGTFSFGSHRGGRSSSRTLLSASSSFNYTQSPAFPPTLLPRTASLVLFCLAASSSRLFSPTSLSSLRTLDQTISASGTFPTHRPDFILNCVHSFNTLGVSASSCIHFQALFTVQLTFFFFLRRS